MLKNKFFAGILKFNDENSRIRIQDPNPDPNPDPLVRGMDPRIRIRIHPKMSWIRNTALKTQYLIFLNQVLKKLAVSREYFYFLAVFRILIGIRRIRLFFGILDVYVPLKRNKHKSLKKKIIFLLASWMSLTKSAGSGSASESVGQRYGSEDPHPDPYQNVTDPEHCFF